MPDEDFDRAQHRLRQEVAARNDWEPATWTMPPIGNGRLEAAAPTSATWTGDLPPEQVDRDAMANYNRCVIAEAARTTNRRIDWLAVGIWGFLALTVLYYVAQVIRWAIR